MTSSFRSACLVAASLAWLACGTDKNTTGNSPGTLTGWWQNPQPGGCLCPAVPECQASDCVGYGVHGILSDGRFYDGHIDISQKLETMSSAGNLTLGSWTAGSGGTMTIVQTNVPDYSISVSVDGDQLHFGFEVDTRITGALGSALDRATGSDAISWKGQPIQ